MGINRCSMLTTLAATLPRTSYKGRLGPFHKPTWVLGDAYKPGIFISGEYTQKREFTETLLYVTHLASAYESCPLTLII